MGYATVEEILAVLQRWQPSYGTGNISTAQHAMATSDVNSTLIAKHVVPSGLTDKHDLLKGAEILYYLERSTNVREIETVFSNLNEEKMAKGSRRYDNALPMFFFAKGASEPFFELLPHLTFVMQAQRYISMYCLQTFYDKNSRFNAKASIYVPSD